MEYDREAVLAACAGIAARTSERGDQPGVSEALRRHLHARLRKATLVARAASSTRIVEVFLTELRAMAAYSGDWVSRLTDEVDHAEPQYLDNVRLMAEVTVLSHRTDRAIVRLAECALRRDAAPCARTRD